MTVHDVGLPALDALEGIDALCLFVAEDERPLRGAAGFVDWRMCGSLSRLLQEGFFTGAPNDSLLLPVAGRFAISRLFVMGIGSSRALTADGLGRTLARAAQTLRKAHADSVAIEVPGQGQLDDGARVSALKSAFLPAFPRSRVAILGSDGMTRLLAAGS